MLIVVSLSQCGGKNSRKVLIGYDKVNLVVIVATS